MKNIVITLVAIIALGITACKKTDSTKNDIGYGGQWSLVTYNPSPMTGTTNANNYNLGDVIWNFNAGNQTVTVTLNNTANNNPLAPGNYNFQLGNHPCNYGSNQYFTINNEIVGVFVLDEIANNQLKITAECFDGAILKFER